MNVICWWQSKAKFENKKWTKIGTLLKPRTYFNVAYFNGHFHVFGSKNGNENFTKSGFKISAEYNILYIGRYKTLHISGQYKPQA